ncbi:MAG: PA domain-containing protein [Thermoanaerobaculia bacterium]
MRRSTLLLAVLLVILLAVPAQAVTITIINKDSAGQGLNDPTPATPVGGNPGTTIGAQRLNVFKKAAEIWGGILPGNVEIRVDASFTPLSCSATSAVLGGTSPTFVESDFGGGGLPGVWYVVAEANQMAGFELEVGQSHMAATFNSNLGQSGCFTGNYFYYGFDTNTPSNDVNLLTVSLHEFAHGLGFISLADETTGTFCCGTQPQPDIFDAFTYDTTAMKSWNDMATDAQRQASAINTGNLVFTGAHANAAGAAYLAKNPALLVSSPPAVAGTYTVGTANFGASPTLAGVSGPVVYAANAPVTGGTSTDACATLTNAAAVAGKLVFVDRGLCSFAQKAANVQAAGGVGAIIANVPTSPNPGTAPGMGQDTLGVWATVTIPLVSLNLSDGNALRGTLPTAATIGLDPSRAAGMNSSGQMLLYAPNPVQAGSNVSHWDTSCSPNLLMEPVINNDLPIGVDITPDALRDIGWFGTTPPSQRLTVTMAGTATGTVTSSPTGITCPGTCFVDFPFETAVTLTASPGTGAIFTGWSGEGCSGTGTCRVGMSVARNVTATFTTGTLPPATILGTAGFANCSGGNCPAPNSATVGVPLTVKLFRNGSPVTSGNASWQITSGNAIPSSGTGLTFTFTPQSTGNFVVTGAVDGVADIPLTVAIAAPPPALMLSSSRVQVTVAWVNPYSGQGGAAFRLAEDDQYGFFYYTDPNNPEVFVKVLDFGTGSALCFVGGLTDFYYKVTFKMARTGQTIVFEKPAYQYIGYVNNIDLKFAGAPGMPAASAAAPGGMTFVGAMSMGEPSAATVPSTAEAVAVPAGRALVAAPQHLEFSTGRVSATVDWRNPYSGETGTAYGTPTADQYGFFYYTDPTNPEVFIKVLDFGSGSALVFVGGLTDFYYKVTFTVLRTGQTLVFEKPEYQYIGFVDNSTLKF